jgi:uncharacterized cupredoxin-like copper-binding protein
MIINKRIRYGTFSILTVFFKPLFYITCGIAVVFFGMLAQVNFIPYRKKFHNLMEYFILLSTLLTLMAGLLLFVVDRDGGSTLVIDPGLRNFLKSILPVITIILIVVSNVVVISMFLYDVYIRRKKDKIKLKNKRKLESEIMENEKKFAQQLDDLHGRSMNHMKNLPWETDHEFNFTVNFHEDSEPEDASTSMNQIFEDIFSIKRGRRNLEKLTNSGRKAMMKFTKKLIYKSTSQNEVTVEDVFNLKKMESNGFSIQSEFPGNVVLISSTSKNSEQN